MAKKAVENVRWEYHYADIPEFSDVPELIMLGYDRFTEAAPLFDHRHARSFEFVFVESGKVTWEVNGTLYPSHAGQLFHTRPDEWHRARFNYIEPCSIWWMILLDPSEVPGWLRLRDDERDQIKALLYQLPRIVSAEARMREQFRKIRHTLKNEEMIASLKVRHSILDILLHILQPSTVREIPVDLREAMIRLTEKMQRSPEMRWTNRQLAAEIGVSESHFYRLFRDIHGQSPASFMDRLRIDLACQMLLHKGASVTSVAMDLGFKTSQHFSTVFKKYTGLTPRGWRSSSH